MNSLTCPLPLFRRLLLALAENAPREIYLRVGQRVSAGAREWLARELVLSPADALALPPPSIFRVTRVAAPVVTGLPTEVLPPSVSGHLLLGDGALRGRAWGFAQIGESVAPLQCLFLPGSGMHTIPLSDLTTEPTLPAERRREFFQRLRWSRTIGALGGKEVWQRLVRLRIGIVGCGRTGSLVAATVARLGVRQITLIDPDLVELHNLGEMDVVTSDDVGQAKAAALADRLRLQSPGSSAILLPITEPLTAPAARAAAQACDVLFCCADNDAARLATAVIATLYHKVLLDIGTGVFFPATGSDNAASAQTARPTTTTHANLPPAIPAPRRMGGDVRLILPGDGCLLCAGNLANYQQAVEDLCHHRLPTTTSAGWRRQRAGSLHTLNQLAAALGVQMLQDVVAERIVATTWAQIECDEAGQLAVNYPAVRQQSEQRACALCAKAGLGDEGLRWL